LIFVEREIKKWGPDQGGRGIDRLRDRDMPALTPAFQRENAMQLPRRRFLQLAAGAAALTAKMRIARAQAYPSRYVRLVVPFPPGGASDPVARVLAHRLSEVWGQQVVIENKGGAGGNIAARAVAQSVPDGYTLFISTAFLATNPYLYRSLGYDPIADFAPVTRLDNFANVMVVPNSAPAKSVREFIDYATTKQGKITFASPGTGTIQHLAGELFKRKAEIEMAHVPYRGGGPALNDLLAGRVDVMFATLPSARPLIESDAIRALAVTSVARSTFAPNTPTIVESGLAGFDVSDWHALFMPAKTPADIVRKVHDDTVTALAHPPVKQRFGELAVEVVTSTPAEATAYLKSEMEKWSQVIKGANIKAE
jgi:tripartite-type tricarboxylate transporter receptor subunit TctC